MEEIVPLDSTRRSINFVKGGKWEEGRGRKHDFYPPNFFISCLIQQHWQRVPPKGLVGKVPSIASWKKMSEVLLYRIKLQGI